MESRPPLRAALLAYGQRVEMLAIIRCDLVRGPANRIVGMS